MSEEEEEEEANCGTETFTQSLDATPATKEKHMGSIWTHVRGAVIVWGSD